METAAAPLLLLSGVALVRWAYSKAGGFGPMLALNILDFTRFARSQRDQIIGQAIGLPIPMGWLSLVAVLVTSAMVVIYGEAIWDPAALTGEMGRHLGRHRFDCLDRGNHHHQSGGQCGFARL